MKTKRMPPKLYVTGFGGQTVGIACDGLPTQVLTIRDLIDMCQMRQVAM